MEAPATRAGPAAFCSVSAAMQALVGLMHTTYNMILEMILNGNIENIDEVIDVANKYMGGIVSSAMAITATANIAIVATAIANIVM